MAAELQRPGETAKQAMREALEGESSKEVLTDALRSILRDALRGAVKDIVEEAVRETRSEPAPSRSRRGAQVLVYLGVGTALGYLAAKRRSSTE